MLLMRSHIKSYKNIVFAMIMKAPRKLQKKLNNYSTYVRLWVLWAAVPRFGAMLGPSGGRQGAVMSCLGAILGRNCGDLEAVLGGLGTVATFLGHVRAVSGPQMNRLQLSWGRVGPS